MTSRFFLWALSMHKFFISFTKWELKICVLVGTSSEVTFLLGVTVSLAGVIDLEASFLRNPASGTCIEGLYARGAYTKSTCFEGTCTKASY